MRYDNACKVVAGSSLMSAIHRRYGYGWRRILSIRMMLAGYVGALEGAAEPDPVLDEMEEMASKIENNAAAA